MTKIRAELSKKNPLYIDRHAFLSAYHFALQYPEWKAQYADMIGGAIRGLDYNDMPKGNIDLIERTALIAGENLVEFILYAVTNEGVTYKYLTGGRCKLGRIPCGKNEYYQRRRMFYYLLSKRMEERNVTG